MSTSSPDFTLKGRRALVTGSSRGIGAAIALGFAEAGADVVVHYTGSDQQALEVAARASDLGVRSTTVRADLAEDGAARRIFDAAAAAFGGVDILVLNAAVQMRKSWLEFSRAEVDWHIAINYRSGLELMQLAAPGMIERKWGRILAIGSVQESKPHPQMLVYSSLKHAQAGLILGIAPQLAPHGVTANNLAPGIIMTDRNTEALADAGYAEKVRGMIPAGRIGESEDCVGAALLLCSEAGRYITGQTLYVDGGLGL